jgi:alanyl-tRNA synthetase
MTTDALSQKFIHFFEGHGHAHVPSSSLLPHADATVLLTTAGMQQFKPHFLGRADAKKDFGAERVVSVQRCFRTSDIEHVGDATHLTFFEMLGNFSFGDYFKAQTIAYAWEFLTGTLKLDPHRFSVTVFAGDADAPRDTEAETLWSKIVTKSRVHRFGRDANWWGPVGPTGPMGPCSELHYDHTQVPCAKGSQCIPNCDCGRWVEVWNLVFIQFEQQARGRVVALDRGQIDTGMGLERLAMVTKNVPTVFDTDRYTPLLKALDHVDHLEAVENETERIRRRRIVADHWKGVVFLLSDGVVFGTKGAGSILRRLLRKAIDLLVDPHPHLNPLTDAVVRIYHHANPELSKRAAFIERAIAAEAESYDRSIREGVERVLKKHVASVVPSTPEPSTRHLEPGVAFELITAYGVSESVLTAKGFTFDRDGVGKLLEQHRAVSRQGATRKFGGHGLNDPDLDPKDRAVMTRMHTATHLLHQALRAVLGNEVQQAGSDIGPERFRFDFTFPRKLTPEELKQVGELINTKITEDLPVSFESMSLEAARQSGALAFFKEKYPDTVTVYSVGRVANGTLFSKEICGGPHVTHSGEIGHVRILKEEASSAGVRRIRAVVEPARS